MVKGKNIIVAVTGSIAAYKAAYIVRNLVKAGAHVKVCMTPASSVFITPLTLSTLSKNPVFQNFTNDDSTGEWNNHVDLGLWADLILIAPATANTLAKMVTGLCDNLLMAVYMSAKAPVMIAPAMDLDMYLHPSTQNNLTQLKKMGHIIIDPEEGELASGLVGKGRMAEPDNIQDIIEKHFEQGVLNGKTALITAGPTYESIDPVRFIGNRSSGKMGYAIAEKMAEAGANVILVSGPTSLNLNHKNIKIINVESAKEMFQAVNLNYKGKDVLIMSAAVADYTVKNVAHQKIKKKDNDLNIEFESTKDILKYLGENKSKNQILVGFALETENEIENAKSKLERKNLDFVVLNSLNDNGAGFGHDTNKISIIDKNNKITSFELKSKAEVAIDIVEQIKNQLTI